MPIFINSTVVIAKRSLRILLNSLARFQSKIFYEGFNHSKIHTAHQFVDSHTGDMRAHVLFLFR